MNENFGLKGRLKNKITRADGTVEHFTINNTIVNDGRATVAALIVEDAGAGSPAFDDIGIGTGDTNALVTDTTLEAEIMSRQDSEGTVSGSLCSFVGSFDMTGTVSVAEYGLFNAATAGSMLARATGTAISLGSEDNLQVTWQIQVG